MAQQNIKLTKKVTSNKYANDIHSKAFEKLAKSDPYIDTERIKEMYDKMFYHIPKEGKLSHQSIVEQSYNYVYFEQNDLKDQQIDTTLNDLEVLNDQLTNAELPNTDEHPVFEDGAFLMAGEAGSPYQQMTDKWVMHEGKKRKISDSIFLMVRRSLGLPEDETGIYFLKELELEDIPSGKAIETWTDLNLKGNDIILDNAFEDIIIQSAFYEVDFFCDGNEIQDSINLILDDNPAALGQFYLNNEGCTLKYLVDNGTVDEILPSIEETFIPKGESKTLKFARDTGLGNSAIPSIINGMAMQDIYNASAPGIITYGGEEVVEYIKEWGPNGKYSGIIHASGRIRYSEKTPNNMNESSQVLNGLPSSPSLGAYYQILDFTEESTLTPYGTKRIFQPGSGLHGALNQDEELQEYFNNLNALYYQPEVDVGKKIKVSLSHLSGAITWITGDSYEIKSTEGRWMCQDGNSFKFKIYGQPIVRAYSRFSVLCGMIRESWTVYTLKAFIFYDIHSGEIWTKTSNQMEGTSLNLEMKTGSGDVQRAYWENVNKDQVKFIGLQGLEGGTVGYNSPCYGNDNPFNSTNGGSNNQFTGF